MNDELKKMIQQQRVFNYCLGNMPDLLSGYNYFKLGYNYFKLSSLFISQIGETKLL